MASENACVKIAASDDFRLVGLRKRAEGTAGSLSGGALPARSFPLSRNEALGFA
jgi:hypothetical protein